MSATAIFKFPVESPVATVTAPRGWRPVHVAAQDGIPTIWAEVNPDAVWESRTIAVVGTGHQLPPEPRTYLGTVQVGAFVWHLYDVTP